MGGWRRLHNKDLRNL